MENIVLTEKLLSSPELLFTSETSAVCAEIYSEFIECASRWFDEG